MILAYGTLATVGHLLLTSAYREAPAATLAPVNYLHIAFATLLGWLVLPRSPMRLALPAWA
jgi:drug/metabolite transporter (DMT)-like permease